MKYYWIKKLFCKRIKHNSATEEKRVRIFLACQYKTDKSTFMVYIDGKESNIILDHSQIIGLLTRDQYREFITQNATIFDVPYDKLLGRGEHPPKLYGRKNDPNAFKIENGATRKR